MEVFRWNLVEKLLRLDCPSWAVFELERACQFRALCHIRFFASNSGKLIKQYPVPSLGTWKFPLRPFKPVKFFSFVSSLVKYNSNPFSSSFKPQAFGNIRPEHFQSLG